jgi:hypothetical protein
MLQLFTSRYADDPDPMIRQIAALGAEGKIAAVQLELSVPLRWPGPLREHFLESASRFLRNEIRDLPTAHDTPSSPTHRQNPPQRLALEFHDGTAGVGGFAAFERLDSGRRHARLLFCLGNARLVLFTGEDATADDDGTRCAGVEWKRSEGDGVALHYDGPCLMFGSSDAFLDLEAGLAAAELSRLEVHLDWKPAGAEGPSSWRSRSGHVTGRVDFDGVHTQIASPATVDTADPTELPKGPWRERRRLRVPLGEEVFLSISSRIDEEELAEGEIARGGVLEPILSATVKVHRGFDGRTPVAWRVDAVSRSGPLRIFGQVTRAIPVVRAAANGRALLFFGLARYSADIGVGYGTFEDWQCLVEP